MKRPLALNLPLNLVLLGTVSFGLGTQDTPTSNESQHVDHYGDPLPEDALLRLGTLRLRHRSSPQCIVFSPDGRTIASAAVNQDAGVYLWETATGKMVRRFKDPEKRWGWTESVAFSPDGTRLASGRIDGFVCLWDVDTGRLLFKAKKHERNVEALAFSPDGARLASGGQDGRVCLLDAATGDELRVFDTGDRPQQGGYGVKGFPGVRGVGFSPDGNLLAAGTGNQKAIHVWDLKTGQTTTRIDNVHGQWLHSLAFMPDGRQLVSGGNAIISSKEFGKPLKSKRVQIPELRFWDLATGKMVRELKSEEPEAGLGGMTMSADAQIIASGARGSIRLWDVASGRSFGTIPLPGAWGRGPLAISDGKTLAAPRNKAIAFWDVISRKPVVQDFQGHAGEARFLSYSPDGTHITSGGTDGRVIVWDAKSGQPLHEHSLGLSARDVVTAMAVSSDGQVLAGGGYGHSIESGGLVRTNVVRVWRAVDGKQLWDLEGSKSFNDDVDRLALSPRGKLLAVAGRIAEHGIDVWEIETQKKIAQLRGKGTVYPIEVRFSDDAKTVCSVSGQPAVVNIWAVENGELRRTWIPHLLAKPDDEPNRQLSISNAVFTPDLKRLITRQDQYLVVWDVASGKSLSTAQVRGRSENGRWIGLSQDGRLLAATDSWFVKDFGPESLIIYAIDAATGAIRVWEPESERPVQVLAAGDGRIRSLAFSPDNQRLVTSMDRGTVLVWELAPAASP